MGLGCGTDRGEDTGQETKGQDEASDLEDREEGRGLSDVAGGVDRTRCLIGWMSEKGHSLLGDTRTQRLHWVTWDGGRLSSEE